MLQFRDPQFNLSISVVLDFSIFPMPLVSIIIPCYNAEKYVVEAIRSALDQTYPHCEVIVVDDGSTDRSLDVIKSFGDKIRWETGPNRGGCAARNRGLELAKGEWIQFLDADDLISLDKIEKQMGSFPPNGKTLITCAWKRFCGRSDDPRYPVESLSMWESPTEWLIQKYSGNGTMPLHAWLAPRSLIDQAGGWDMALTRDQDGEFFDHLSMLADSIAHIPEVMAYYRSALTGSVSGRGNERAMLSCLESLDHGTRRLLERDESPRARKACAVAYMRLAGECWPNYAAISEEAERRACSLGGADSPCSGGKVFLAINALFGWKTARRAQSWWCAIHGR